MKVRKLIGFALAGTWLAALLAGSLPAATQQAGGVMAGEPKFRALRAVSGSKGEEQAGRYVILDPRTIFYIPEDRQVIVYFEWEGPVGPHKFQGVWKNPEGKVTLISDFEYSAQQKRFGGYWKLLLGEQMQTGVWTIEASVDGEQAGSHTIQILAASKPAESGAPARIPLTAAKMYQLAQAGTVSIERRSAAGEKLGSGSGFIIGDDVVVTAFQVIDGAAMLRVVLPDGRTVQTDELLSWNRRQDWAILRVAGSGAAPLKRATANSWSVGDRCYALDVAIEGNRIIMEADILGQSNPPSAGERLNISFFPNSRAVGGPLLNEYGEVVGMVGGALIPGTSSLDGMQFGWYASAALGGGSLRGGLAVPITLITLSTPRHNTLADLAKAGHFIPTLTAYRHILSGSLGNQVISKSGFRQLVEEKHEFSKKDTQVIVYLGWDPKEKRKGLVTLRAFDVDNRALGQSKPYKVDLKPKQPFFIDWTFPIANMQAGIYRIDVYLDEEPAWRTFFRIVE